MSDKNPVDSDDVPTVLRLLRRGRVRQARVRLHKNKYFELDFGYRSGKRFRKYRTSPTEAYRTAVQVSQELRELGALARELSAAQRIEAAECFRLLEPTGARLRTVVDEFLKRHPLAGNARTIMDVIGEVVRKKKTGNRRARYVRDLEYKLRCFEKAFPGRGVGSVTTEEVEDWIAQHTWAPGTVRSHVDSWNVLFNYAVLRGYRLENPCDKLELPTREQKEPHIFTVDQVRQMMALAVSRLPECRAWAAIATFAGLRPMREIGLLQWEKISFPNKTITVDVASAKTRERRVVDMSLNLVAWLEPIAKAKGDVLERPVNELRVKMRDAMGLEEWPHDVLRHCFATYHFAKHRNAQATTYQMGHGRDTDVFYQHYRALVQPAEADAFWEIYPPRPA